MDKLEHLESHVFFVSTVYSGGGDGDGLLRLFNGKTVEYGLPESIGGMPGRSNPAEMLVSAVASGYAMTLHLLLECEDMRCERIVVNASGRMIRMPDRSLHFAEIVLGAKLHYQSSGNVDVPAVLDLSQCALERCAVTKALSDSLALRVEPQVILV